MKCHRLAYILARLRDADARLNSGMVWLAVLQAVEVSESTLGRWHLQYRGQKSKEAIGLKKLAGDNGRLKEAVADLMLDIRTLKHIADGIL